MAKSQLFFALICVVSVSLAGRQRYNPHVTLISAGSQQIPKVAGYQYPVPSQTAASSTRAQTQPAPVSPPSSIVERLPAASAQEQSVQQVSATPSIETSEARNDDSTIIPAELTTTPAAAVTAEDVAVSVAARANVDDHIHPAGHHSAQIEAIDVACGKERMTVRVTFDSVFNGIIYAKGHYSDPNCRFVTADSGQKMYQFDLTTGQCGVSFIDAGLTDGGQAYVEGLLVIIVEPGVQEAWDAARKIRCLWEGNLEQTVTFPLSVNMLEQKLLTFSGDTATVSLEIQTGDGPRAPAVQGLVRIGDMLTAVVTVQGDNAFDLLVRNCVATDGTPDNRIILSDSRGCATKPKLMGGWVKEKNTGNVLAYAKLSAFKFPDVMDLFLECTVSLCKGTCEECPAAEYLELHVPAHDHAHPETTSLEQGEEVLADTINIKTTSKGTSSKIKRSVLENADSTAYNQSVPGESLRLHRVVHVVGPDDLPEFTLGSGSAVYGNLQGNCQNDCVSLMGLVAAVSVTALVLFISVAIFGTLRRRHLADKC